MDATVPPSEQCNSHDPPIGQRSSRQPSGSVHGPREIRFLRLMRAQRERGRWLEGKGADNRQATTEYYQKKPIARDDPDVHVLPAAAAGDDDAADHVVIDRLILTSPLFA